MTKHDDGKTRWTRPEVADGEGAGLYIYKIGADVLNKDWWTAEMG
jgi:hypothetical protein